MRDAIEAYSIGLREALRKDARSLGRASTGEGNPHAQFYRGVFDVSAPVVEGSEPADALSGVAAVIEGLVPAAVAGDRRARDLLMAEIQPLVLRYCRGRLGRTEGVIGSADDVAQEVCVAVVSALPHYEIKGLSFRAFVYGIAAHKVTDAFRAIGRNRTEPVADLPDAPVLHDGPEQRMLMAELTERLGHLLYRLTPRQREVLVLRVVVGMSAEETAQAVGSTPGAVRVTQHRALCRLRGVLADAGEVDPEDPDDLPDMVRPVVRRPEPRRRPEARLS